MSGVAALVPPPGAPADRALAERMAAFLAYRGPHAQHVELRDGCALVHASLDTGDETASVPQPFSLDGETWITADARIDGREQLTRDLASAGEDAREDASAAELLLRAWRAWGADCVPRLIGDFAFAVWDGPRQRLFCARDAFGVKPLYHATAVDGTLVVSNTLDCVLLHPGVDRAIDEAAVADFLVHGFHQDGERTIRRGVRALAPGHALLWEGGRARTWRWWSLPVDEPLRHRRVGEYVDHFLEVFGAAVRDRTPPARASIFLSGGRDSPSIAALARETRPGTRIHGFTAYYDHLIREDERRYAAMAAERLSIPVTWLAVDGYRAFERFESPELARPEPVDAVLMAIEADQWRQAAAHAPVLLTGFGGDAALRETRSRLARLVMAGHLLRAAGEAARYARLHRRIPRPGIRTWLRVRGTRQTAPATIPPWIDADFARRVDLRARVAAQNEPQPIPHPTRPEAYEQLASPLWPHLFTYQDAGVTRVPLSMRHPFFDVRLVRFLLSVPPAQWYNDKGLLRIGMHGRLPDALLRRPKTPLPGDPMAVRLARDGNAWLRGRTLGADVERFVDAARVSRVTGGRGDGPPDDLWRDLRPLGLDLWLRARGAG